MAGTSFFSSGADSMMKGVAIVFDSRFENGWRSDMDIMIIATWDGKEGEIFTDLDLSEKVLGSKIWHISEPAWKESKEQLVGHNLHGEFAEQSIDLLQEVKAASGEYFDHEGKRYTLYDLAKWNRCRPFHHQLITKVRRQAAWLKGQHIRIARWALEDARLCYDLYHKLLKEGEVKISDALTGKKPSIPITLPYNDGMITVEEE